MRYTLVMSSSRKTAIAKLLRKNQTMSVEKFWYEVKAKRLGGYKFRRQVVIGKFVADFVCEQKKLIIELDGSHHADQIEKDEQRTAELEKFGYRVIRIWNHEVIDNLAGTLDWLLHELDSVDT